MDKFQENRPDFDSSIEREICCSSCRAPLFRIINKNNDSLIKTKIKAKCPHCGGNSYNQDLVGDFFYGNSDYTIFTDMIVDEVVCPITNMVESRIVEVQTEKVKTFYG